MKKVPTWYVLTNSHIIAANAGEFLYVEAERKVNTLDLSKQLAELLKVNMVIDSQKDFSKLPSKEEYYQEEKKGIEKFYEVLKASKEFTNGQKIAICAQTIVESSRGTSELALKANNFCGVMFKKEFEGVQGLSKYPYTSPSDNISTDYLKCDTPERFLTGYLVLINRSVYAGWKTKTSALDYITHLKACGYAADPKYVAKTSAVFEEAQKILGIKEEEKPVDPIDPTEGNLKGVKILLDPGHSKSYPGARGKSPDYPKEEIFTLQMATALQKLLAAEGATVEIYNPDADELETIGAKAKGFNLFLSIHLNASAGKDFYTCVMIDKNVYKAGSKKFAKILADHTSKALGGHKQNSGNPPGVMEASLGVLRAAEATNCPICVLSEGFFIDAYGSNKDVEYRCSLVVKGMMSAILEEFGKKETPVPVDGFWDISRSSDAKLSSNFTASEFACKCGKCSNNKIYKKTVDTLQMIREHFGKAVTVTSGYRCPAHNAAVGGQVNSEHLKGLAADFYIEGISPQEITKYLESKNFHGGLGTYAGFNHVDAGENKRWID